MEPRSGRGGFPNGSIYVAGEAGSTVGNNHAYFLARYLPSGQIDPTFGTNGVVVRYLNAATGEHVLRGVVVDSQQRPAVAGYFTGDLIHVARFDTNGVLDPTFGSAGEVTGPGGSAYALVVSGTKLVAAGKDDKTPAHGFAGRLNENGTPDTAFGNQSFVTANTGSTVSDAVAVAIDADNKVVIAGNTPNAVAVVARFTPGGAADAFGTAGVATMTLGSGLVLTGMAVRPDKRIVGAGAPRPTSTSCSSSMRRGSRCDLRRNGDLQELWHSHRRDDLGCRWPDRHRRTLSSVVSNRGLRRERWRCRRRLCGRERECDPARDLHAAGRQGAGGRHQPKAPTDKIYLARIWM